VSLAIQITPGISLAVHILCTFFSKSLKSMVDTVKT
jgi:hypothetical protein